MMSKVQELIDERKRELPVDLVKELLDACKAEAEATKQLYKLTWTMVDSHAHVVEVKDEPDVARVKLSHKTQTLIVEKVDRLPKDPDGWTIRAMELPDHGMVLKGWVEHFTKQPFDPLVLMPCDDLIGGATDRMVIVNSIVPYESHKRAREE